MARYVVDVKTFFSFEVDADTPEAARIVADAFIENVMCATHATVEGYNSGVDRDAIGHVVPSEICPGIDGETEVSEADE